jgi:murein DD-endopeptidase MepM/ murein hydrolase activator NlpD
MAQAHHFQARRLARWAVLALFFPHQSLAQGHSGFPVDIVAGPAPQPVVSEGRGWLVYELHLTNYAPLAIELTRVEVFGDDGTTLASYRGQEIEKAVVAVEELSSADSPSGFTGTRTLGAGHAAMMFINLSLEPGARRPKELHHRFSFTITRNNGEIIQRTVDAAVVPVVQEPVPVLAAPLRGSLWIAFNAFGAADHRRSLNAVDGRERIPQRFAIDWAQLGPDRRLFHGDTKSNENYYGYGAEVLAVADGRVSDTKDDMPENNGSSDRSNRTITIDNAVGNYVIVDLGRGRFALYAHLQRGSLKVKAGDKVSAGQVLAKLGNSGNSDAPHLHFQLMDANSALGSEGMPCEFASFTQLGVVGDQDTVLDAGQPWQPKAPAAPMDHRGEFPVDKAVVNFQ